MKHRTLLGIALAVSVLIAPANADAKTKHHGKPHHSQHQRKIQDGCQFNEPNFYCVKDGEVQVIQPCHLLPKDDPRWCPLIVS